MFVPTIGLGAHAPDFDLPGVDNGRYSLSSFAGKPVLVVIFSCNHCPYVKDYETRWSRFRGITRRKVYSWSR